MESNQNMNPNELCSSIRTSREMLLTDQMDLGLIQKSKFSTFDKDREKANPQPPLSNYREMPDSQPKKNVDIPEESPEVAPDSNILL